MKKSFGTRSSSKFSPRESNSKFCKLAKINLITLYINRHFTHKVVLPQKILEDCLQILQECKELNWDGRKQKIYQNTQNIPYTLMKEPKRHIIKTQTNKIKLKKVESAQLKQIKNAKEVQVISHEEIISKLKNQILDHQIKANDYKLTIAKQKQIIRYRDKQLKHFKEKLQELTRPNRNAIISETMNVRVEGQHPQPNQQLMREVLREKQNEMKVTLMLCHKVKEEERERHARRKTKC